MTADQKTPSKENVGTNIINYEYTEFIKDQKQKRPYRTFLSVITIVVPALILLAWSSAQMGTSLTDTGTTKRIIKIITKSSKIALAVTSLYRELLCMSLIPFIGKSLKSDNLTRWDLNPTQSQSQTELAVKEPLIWENLPLPPSRAFNFTDSASLISALSARRAATADADLKGVLANIRWYQNIATEFYSQVPISIRANEDLPIWPNYLDVDFAMTYYQFVTQKAIIGTWFLVTGPNLAEQQSLWHALIEPISNQDVLYSLAFYMAPSFRRFVRNIETNANGTVIDWAKIDEVEGMFQNATIKLQSGGGGIAVDIPTAERYLLEMLNILNETEAYVKRSSQKSLKALSDEDSADMGWCIGSAIVIIISLTGGYWNLRAIRNFLRRFEKQVSESAANHREATIEMRIERKKTNQVIHSMLPKKIADELKFRKFVRPAFFESVSMYFSDVQGYTALSSRSTPEQMVQLLTEIYTKFDELLDKFRVWKLETIGDAYSIIAGSTNPEEFDSPMEHAVEMVNCSLCIRDLIKDYPITHFPNEKIKIRIGVHTGSVITGVAGVGVHRYCVVGDSLHIVQSIEASGKHGRVHISQNTLEAIFSRSSTETVNSRATSDGDRTLDHPNEALYVWSENLASDITQSGRKIPTFWIDRKDPTSTPSFVNDALYAPTVAGARRLSDDVGYIPDVPSTVKASTAGSGLIPTQEGARTNNDEEFSIASVVHVLPISAATVV